MLLVASLLAVVLPLAHELHEALQAPESAARVAPAFETACPPDCDERGHRHHAHDKATCSSCKLLHGAGALAASVAVPTPQARVRSASSERGSTRAQSPTCAASPRGPPSLTLLA